MQEKILVFVYLFDQAVLVLWILLVTISVYFFDIYSSVSAANLNSLIIFVISFLVLILGFSGAFDTTFAVLAYQIASTIALVFIGIQILAFYTFKTPISGKIPILNLDPIYYEAFSYLSQRIGFGNYVRFSSLFSEPAHFAQYVIPLLCMKLYGFKNLIKKNLLHASVITLLILISTSGFGIVSVGIVWVLFFVLSRNKRGIVRRILFFSLGISILLFAFYSLMTFDFFSYTVSNLFSSPGNFQSKADYRVYRGFALFANLPLIHQIFGTGFKNMSSVANYYNIWTKYDVSSSNYEYMNTVAQILIYSGIMGFVLFIRMVIILYINSNEFGKTMVVVFFSLCISSSTFLDPTWQLYILIIYSSMTALPNYQNTVNK